MKNPLLWKGIALFALVLVLMIPLSMVHSTITERAAYQWQAREDIAHSWGGAQTIVGPVLLQTYEVEVVSEVWDKNLEAYVEKAEWQTRRHVVYPERLLVDGQATVEKRYRGIYAVPVYRADIELAGTLVVPSAPADARNVAHDVLVGVSDTRGFRQQPSIVWQGAVLQVQPGTGGTLNGGVHANVSDARQGRYDVNVQLVLGGSERLEIAPLGGDTQMRLESNWPHPRFTGGYLPESHAIDSAGFQADWKTSHYATTVRDAVTVCVRDGRCDVEPTQMIALELAEPVNVYLLNERSVKYGLLFVLVVFGVFLLFELLRRMRVHPVQYGLVGLGQAMFFLLLLSLSEHVAFGIAYLIGAAACTLLLAFYVSHVLAGWLRGVAFAGLLGAIYAALYVILQSEDHALLLGAMLLFGLLAVAMYLTRNIDWYSLASPWRSETEAS